ncbi:ABC transporter permease [Spirosoma terrae]|uniref:FtsX-like permease family protein n=1 Tax=Spirosoma terrae TaxID=1968276 RepID=A0A6L9LJ52_9BACT|nr:ABC transporter permease [Spirosoma terrae]NDU99281.1 FtsX-like permease family protein [Spirosoma terrae]
MFRNHIKISLRNLWRNRKISTISIVGLSIGLACGIVIFLLVSYLFSFDRYHEKADRTYWVVTDIRQDNIIPTDATPRPLGDVLRQKFPFVQSVVRIENMFGHIISVPDGKGGYTKKFDESRNLCFTEPQFFDIFDVEWISGNPKTALSAPSTVVLSQQYAQKYFGSANPIGKTLRLDNRIELTVTGLVKDLPSNTKLHYDGFISYATIPVLSGDQGKQAMQNWESVSTVCFVTLRQGTPVGRLIDGLNGIRQHYLTTQEAKKLTFHALTLDDLNHNPQYGGRAPRPILYALIAVGVFLILAACINFINLTTAYALKRSKEVGVRKVMGSSRRQLIGQFMTQTALVTVAAIIFSLLLAQLALPLLNQALAVLHTDLSILDVFKPRALVWFGSLIISVILVAGFYPSLVLARFNPVAALRAGYGQLTAKQVGSLSVRRGLVVTQFFITQLFIISVIVMMAQVRHMQQTNLGFQKVAILMVPIPTSNAIKQELVRNQLGQLAGVEQISLCAEPPASHRRIPVPFTYDTHTETEKFPTTVKVGDKNFVPLFGIKLLAGRNFLNNDTTNSEALVNVTMVKQLGLHAPSEVVGKQLQLWGSTKTIVGVVNDFHTSELREAIPPTTMLNYYRENRMIAIKLNPADLPATVKAVETNWTTLFPEQVFKADFVDDLLNQFYLTERILLGLAEVFSLIAILLGCLGLYGLVAFMAEAKTKEIGIRKVLGGSPNELLWLFGREFSRLLVIGFLLAAPLGWFLMNNWLRGYVYHIPFGWWIFAVTLLSTVLITALTVGYESRKAALLNPAIALKCME